MAWLSVGKSFVPVAPQAAPQPPQAVAPPPTAARAVDLNDVVAAAAGYSSSSSSTSSSASPSSKKRKHKRKHKRKRGKRRRHGKDNDKGKGRELVVRKADPERDVYTVDTTGDPTLMEYGTVMDPPLYSRAAVHVRHTLGASALASYERRWLTSGNRTQSAADVAAVLSERQVAGVAPKPVKPNAARMHTHRYYAEGAVPKRATVRLAASRRRQRHLQDVAATTARRSAVDALRTKAQDLKSVLEAGLAAQGRMGKVTVFGGPVVVPAEGPPGPGRTSLGFIPVDPPSTAFLPDADEVPDDEEVPEGIGAAPAVGESWPAFVRRRTQELNVATRERPRDEATWFRLAAFQEVGIDQGAGRDAARMRHRDKAIAGKRVGIFRKGLTHCPGSVRLWRAMLQAASVALPAPDVGALWAEALEALPGEASLWVAFLRHSTSLYSAFTVAAARDAIATALATIRNFHRQEVANDAAAGVHVFHSGLGTSAYRRTCAMLALFEEGVALDVGAGGTERGTAAWQALLEFNLDVPNAAAGKPRPTRLKFFEAFWDSDWPRVGDAAGGTGWSTWLSAKLVGEDAVADVDPVPPDGGCGAPSGEVAAWGSLGRLETSLPDTTTNDGPGEETPALVVGTPTQLRMVYSQVHGHRIPLPVDASDADSSSFYHKILGELADTGGDARAAAKAARAARRTLAASVVPHDDGLMAWLSAEDAASHAQWLPVRARGGGGDDSRRTVPYSHLSGTLFDVGPALHVELLQRALAAFGVTTLHRTSSNASHVQTAATHAAAPPAWLLAAGMDDAHAGLPTVGDAVSESWLPFSEGSPLAPTVAATFLGAHVTADPTHVAFLGNVLQRLSTLPAARACLPLQAAVIDAQAQLAVAGAMPVDAARDAAKATLGALQASTSPAYLLPWLAFAVFEARVGCLPEACRVLDKAVALSAKLPPGQSRHRFFLWFAGARLALATATDADADAVPGTSQALHMLCAAVEGSYTPYARTCRRMAKAIGVDPKPSDVVTPTRLLAARSSFSKTWTANAEAAVATLAAACEAWVAAASASPAATQPPFSLPPTSGGEHLFATGDWLATAGRLSPLAAFACCRALFEYLANGLPAAEAVFDAAVRLFMGCARMVSAAATATRAWDADVAAVDAAAAQCLGAPPSDPPHHGSVWQAARPPGGPGGDDPLYSVDTTVPSGAAVDCFLLNAEWVYGWWVSLVHTHARSNPTPPRVLRCLLEAAIAAFPANTTFLGLYMQTEARMRVAIRARQFLEDLTATPDCPPTVWLAVVYGQVLRASASPHRVRRLFEKVLRAGVGARIPVLWRWYLRFELACGDPLAAKKVYLRAVACCPWSKPLWTDGVRRLRPYLSPDELVDLLKAAVGKGIVVRSPLAL